MSRKVSMQFGKPGGVANRSGDSSGYYSPGETVSVNVQGYGFITDSRKELRLILPLSKNVDKVSAATITAFVGGIRGVSGYVQSTAYDTDWMALSNLTWTATPLYSNLLLIVIDRTAAYSNTTNNTPISVAADIQLTFA